MAGNREMSRKVRPDLPLLTPSLIISIALYRDQKYRQLNATGKFEYVQSGSLFQLFPDIVSQFRQPLLHVCTPYHVLHSHGPGIHRDAKTVARRE